MEARREHDLLTDIYAAFNARDIDRCLAGMQPDVTWANGMDGGQRSRPPRRPRLLDTPMESSEPSRSTHKTSRAMATKYRWMSTR